MNAKKCDKCGKYYDEYGTQNNRKMPNSIIFANTDVDGRYFSHKPVELCPLCMEEVKKVVYMEVKK